MTKTVPEGASTVTSPAPRSLRCEPLRWKRWTWAGRGLEYHKLAEQPAKWSHQRRTGGPISVAKQVLNYSCATRRRALTLSIDRCARSSHNAVEPTAHFGASEDRMNVRRAAI